MARSTIMIRPLELFSERSARLMERRSNSTDCGTCFRLGMEFTSPPESLTKNTDCSARSLKIERVNYAAPLLIGCSVTLLTLEKKRGHKMATLVKLRNFFNFVLLTS